MDDHLQTMSIEEQRTVAEPVEGLEEILLDNSRPERMTRIGTLASPSIRQVLTTFQKENQDVFAWSHEDMPGIDPSVMIKLDETDQEKTSFVTSQSLFCYKVMPFGLKNAGATYQRLMNKMFAHQIGRNVQVYVDDMLVKS
ncbi:uncharacterized protein LOC126728834 [Quercus robur]|uniref:uncharacterized protein LOC126728834 n=1 Tax=Quercus robur TaxID=38942 RepID=UPI002163B1E8|nr:uncharacterized protein LOC126728834 [Quercus robur]